MVKCCTSWLILNSSTLDSQYFSYPYSDKNFLAMFQLKIDLINSQCFLCYNKNNSIGNFYSYLFEGGIFFFPTFYYYLCYGSLFYYQISILFFTFSIFFVYNYQFKILSFRSFPNFCLSSKIKLFNHYLLTIYLYSPA